MALVGTYAVTTARFVEVSISHNYVFKAGYRVMCVTDERLCRVTSLRHSVALLGMCSILAPITDLTSISFALGISYPFSTLMYLSIQIRFL